VMCSANIQTVKKVRENVSLFFFFGFRHSRPQSSSLLRMTDGEKSSGELGQKVCSDWFIIETIKTFLIGQFTAR